MKALALALVLAACSGERSTTTLVLEVTDGVGGSPIAARVLLFDAAGEPLHIGSIDLYGQRQGATACVLSKGVIGTWDGIVLAYGRAAIHVGADGCKPTPAIPYGHYKVWAWHGLDHELWEGEVDLPRAMGRVELTIPLERAWQTPDTVLAADLHVHAHASNDSGMPDVQRVAAQVAAGIQVMGLSNHNSNGDASAAIAELSLEHELASIPSNEITSEMMHAGIYPATGAALPEADIVHADPKALLAKLRTLSGHPIVQLNHPRFRYQSLFDTTHWDGTSWPPPFPLDFDAMEVVAGYSAANAPKDRRLDDVLRDYYTLTDHGHLIAAMGGSDTHDFNWVLDGTARTYVTIKPGLAHPFDRGAFIDAIRNRRTVATSGPWLEVSASPAKGDLAVGPGQSVAARGGSVWLEIHVQQARWMHATRLRITIGAVSGPPTTQTIEIPREPRSFAYSAEVVVGAADTFIGVAVDGDEPLPLPLTGTYQRDKWKYPGVTPFAVISPILVDADGDHHWKRGDADVALP